MTHDIIGVLIQGTRSIPSHSDVRVVSGHLNWASLMTGGACLSAGCTQYCGRSSGRSLLVCAAKNELVTANCNPGKLTHFRRYFRC